MDAETRFAAGDRVQVTDLSKLTGHFGQLFSTETTFEIIEVEEVKPPHSSCGRWHDVWEDMPTPRTTCWGKEQTGVCHCEEKYEQCHPHQLVTLEIPKEQDGIPLDDLPSAISFSGKYLKKVGV